MFLFCAMVFPLLFMSGAYVLYNAIKTRTLPRLLSFGENRGSPFAQAIKSAANNIGANAVDASADDVDEDEYEDDSEYAETDDDTPAAPPLTEALKKEYLTSLRGNPKKCPHCGGTNLTMQQGYSEEISSDAKLMKCEDCGYTWRPAVDSPFFWWLGVVLIILGICGVILQVVGWSSESGARLPPFIFVGGFITIYIGIKTIVFSFGLKGKTAIIAAGITSKDKASS
ncbi:MAG: hypothetical protein HZA50_05795 [Planctomycetes bacterium]|nr:hypothetical protein [Planctomycetota bacterium]